MFSGKCANEKLPYINVYLMSMILYVHQFFFYASSYIYMSIYIYIYIYIYFLEWALLQERSQESLGPRVGLASSILRWTCCAAWVRPACRAGCRNRGKHENVLISESNWIQKVNTDGYAKRFQHPQKYTFLATRLQEFE
jgi:hypothetical protein